MIKAVSRLSKVVLNFTSVGDKHTYDHQYALQGGTSESNVVIFGDSPRVVQSASNYNCGSISF